MKVAEIDNNRSSGISGTLRLRLWATSSVFHGGTITGYVLATSVLGQLKAGYHLNNLNKTVSYSPPPRGTYDLTLTLEEYNNGTYSIVSYLNFPNTFTR